MAKFYGKIGFFTTVEVEPGLWVDKMVERPYFGDLLRNLRRLETSSNVNDNINISNQISILADPYAYDNFHSIKYVEFMNSKWKVTSVEVQYPRLILEIGGVYNGEQATIAE